MDVAGIRERHLYICKDFYKAYSDILRTVSAKLYLSDSHGVRILRLLSTKSIATQSEALGTDNKSASNLLLERLSFSHFIELLKLDTALKREFYEVETIKNSWSVRDLQRAMNSMLYERTGLSTNKHAVLNNEVKQAEVKAENIFRNAYMLEFLGLEEKPPVYHSKFLYLSILLICQVKMN